MKKLVFILIITLAVFVFSLSCGAVGWTQLDVDMFLNIRLPRVIMAFLVGSMLAQSGALLQLLLRNPLADGFTTGIASAAALGAVLGMVLGLSFVFIPVVALVFALVGLGIIFHLGRADKTFHFTTIILAGIVLNIICSAIISFLKYYFDESLGAVVFWLMGGFYGITYAKIIFVTVVACIGFIWSYSQASTLNILAFDDLSANSLGVDVKKERKKFFVLAAILTAVTVSVSGIIGFVGLIVPHLVRGIFGPDMNTNILYSSLIGANFLLLADTLSRIIIPSGAELPVGVMTAFIGGVFFVFLLKYKVKQIW